MLGFCRLVIAANGVAYLPQEARPGIVPRLLQEILSTRIMVKAAMKSTPASHKVLQVAPLPPPSTCPCIMCCSHVTRHNTACLVHCHPDL